MRLRRAGLAVVVLAVVAVAALGLVRAAGVGGTPSRAEQVDAVAATLRCPTCGQLSMKDSTSVVAAGSRQIIARQLAQGRTPDQIRQYFVDRYGESVLLSPDPAGPGLLAWLVPALVVPLAGALIWHRLRRSRGSPKAAGPADDAARAALAEFRAGRLDPDASPSGEALREALLARIAGEEDGLTGSSGEPDLADRLDARLAAAYRRYTVRSVAAPSRGPARALPRRAITVVAAVVVLGLAGAGVAVGLRGRAAGQPPTGSGPGMAAASSSAAARGSGGLPSMPSMPSMPSPPPGYTGGMPRTAAQWVTLGRAYDHAGRFPQAVAAYDMALRMQPGADDVVLLRDNVLVRAGQSADALPTLKQLAARYPDNSDVLLVYGLALNRTGSPEAEATLRRFLALAPDSPAAPGVRKLLDGG